MTTEREFWNWFVQHEKELFNYDAQDEVERERMFDELATELQKVDRDLTFEIGPNGPKREFVISAGGIDRAFPVVVSLAAAKPALKRWTVTAFRPRRPPTAVEFRGKRIDPSEVSFSLFERDGIPGLYLFIPGYREEDKDLKQIGYIMLDEVLGEYDVETRVGPIGMVPPETPTGEERYPLSELPSRFDAFASRLEGRSMKP
jgi:hypothetical protein